METAFAQLTVYLRFEVDTLGYPGAALATYNVMACVKAALRAEHGAAKAQEKVSDFYLAD